MAQKRMFDRSIIETDNFLNISLTAKKDLTEFREYKTGMREWTQAKVNTHGQLIFYAVMIWLKTGKLPECWLDWIRTEYDEYGEIKVTGEWKSFKRRPFSLVEVGSMLKRIEKAVATIGGLMDDWAPDGLATKRPAWESTSAKIGDKQQ
jgi:hypothetical protein